MQKSSEIDRERFETLIEINTLINAQQTDTRELLTHIVNSAMKLTSGDSASLLLVNHENNRLYFEISLGAKGTEVIKFSLGMGEGIAGWVAENNTGLIVNDAERDRRFFSDIDKKTGYSTNSVLASPMRIKDSCVGVLEIINRVDGSQFTENDLFWLDIFSNQAAIALQNAKNYQKLSEQLSVLQDKIKADQGYHTLIVNSPVMLEKMKIVEKVAVTDSSVLILGESGVGKELIAEQIHQQSRRADRPFIRVNCAALPEHLLESELFGHVKGAFTDATADRRGRFELADGGTIFLDEMGEFPLKLQSKLLRVLQNQVFEKVGSSEPVTVDVRVLAATNKDMEKALEEKRFRRDLYYRLNVLPLTIPPLRERPEDIMELAEFFLKKERRELNKEISGFSAKAEKTLLSYHWPGNVRELENVIERSVVICDESEIQPRHLLLTGKDEKADYEGKPLKDAVTIFKKGYITNALNQFHWNQTETAKHLGIQRTYLSRLIKELEINN